ncbi:hypothetical protein HPP92_001109 [Vanilla planifolia]|uniref:Uncharacterized protein n=1 Tax=Vanilla planifolia TaxID=51239 RepID=A0A835VJD0_VANPL|nr:hypothetical protein HPP92_001109 [Vanilla planifolia]
MALRFLRIPSRRRIASSVYLTGDQTLAVWLGMINPSHQQLLPPGSLTQVLLNSSRVGSFADGKGSWHPSPRVDDPFSVLWSAASAVTTQGSRLFVAENLPEDPATTILRKIFSAVGKYVTLIVLPIFVFLKILLTSINCSGSQKTIRTCYPQTPNGATNPTNRSSKQDMPQ